jgi:hypothetical protein
MANSIIKNHTKQWETVTLPFTPRSNGVLLIVIRCKTTGRYYAMFNGTTPTSIADAYGMNGQYANIAMGVTAGTNVSVSSTLNLDGQIMYKYLPVDD